MLRTSSLFTAKSAKEIKLFFAFGMAHPACHRGSSLMAVSLDGYRPSGPEMAQPRDVPDVTTI